MTGKADSRQVRQREVPIGLGEVRQRLESREPVWAHCAACCAAYEVAAIEGEYARDTDGQLFKATAFYRKEKAVL